jgi:hypothetical protein
VSPSRLDSGIIRLVPRHGEVDGTHHESVGASATATRHGEAASLHAYRPAEADLRPKWRPGGNPHAFGHKVILSRLPGIDARPTRRAYLAVFNDILTVIAALAGVEFVAQLACARSRDVSVLPTSAPRDASDRAAERHRGRGGRWFGPGPRLLDGSHACGGQRHATDIDTPHHHHD